MRLGCRDAAYRRPIDADGARRRHASIVTATFAGAWVLAISPAPTRAKPRIRAVALAHDGHLSSRK